MEKDIFANMSFSSQLPDRTMTVHEEHKELFFKLMHERMMIWKRRFLDKKERPWTDNEILRDYKFTNVYRDLDRNSQWQIKNIIMDDSLDLKNLIWKMMVFRFFNNPETFTFDPKKNSISIQTDLFGAPIKSGLKQADNLEELISATKWRNGIPDYDEYDEDEFSRFIAGVRSTGKNPYTTAYLINSQATPGQPRDYCYTRVVVPTLHRLIPDIIKRVQEAEKPEDIINYLIQMPSTALFIAHEFYQDFTYIPKYTNREFMKFDQNDFTNVGPGASIGIRLIYPSLKNTKEQKQAIYWLRDEAETYLKKIARDRKQPLGCVEWDKEKKEYRLTEKCNITLHQIEMWLCEFQKYWKMTIKTGKQRSKFEPKTQDLIVKR